MNKAFRVTAGALFLVLGVGCGSEAESGSEVGNAAPSATRVDSLNMPAEAAKAMKAAQMAAMTPLFFACPRYLSYAPQGFDANWNDTPAWFGPVIDQLDVDKPTTYSAGGTFQVVCGSTQSNREYLSVRRNLPAGYSSCTTSPVGQVNAWFVCT